MRPTWTWTSWLVLVGCSYEFGGAPDGAGAAEGTASQASSGSTSTSVTSTSANVASSASNTSQGTGGASPESALRDCLEIRDVRGITEDGIYLIDPDGPEGEPPFQVQCDMTTEGGGWTRFNWLGGAFVAGADPLGKALVSCNVADLSCPGRIPQVAMPTDLLVRDLGDGSYAAWTFDEANETSNHALAALRDKVPSCYDGEEWPPFVETSNESFCTDYGGGCDAFQYADNCKSDAWVLELDDDNLNCGAAFKIGRTGGSGGACEDVDWGFLDDCGCQDESGALYYR